MLSSIVVEILPRHALSAQVTLDGQALARAVKSFLFQTAVTVSELFLLHFEGVPIVGHVKDLRLPFDPEADAVRCKCMSA